MENYMVRLDRFNMKNNYFKAVKFKTKNNNYFIKQYNRKIIVNKEVVNNRNIQNEFLMKDIKHPNLIEMIDAIKVNEYTYMIYKYYNFPDLIDIYINPLSILEIYFFNKNIIIQLLDVVSFLHSKNIVHRDIKMDNILYDEMRCKIYLCDFEYCSKYYEEDDNIHITTAGTNKYLAPEIINKQTNINHKKVDIWNLGIVFFIILSKGELLKISEFLQPSIVKKYILENEYEFISKCLESNPLDRLEANELLELEYLK